ncbi:MAG TPA: ABC transporter permease, partial [Chloroflexota bacterium]
MTPGEPLIRWDWVARHLGDIAQRTGEHLLLAGLAVSIGFLLSMALGIWAARRPGVYGPVTWVAGVLYTIPSLALFALLIPFTGLSLLTAEIGLVSYTLLILVRNIVAGIRAVPPEVRDSALGMGCTPSQVLWRIELPLALSVIIAGIRVATITTIGLVTVT